MRIRTPHLLLLLVPICAVAQITFAQQPAAQAPAAPGVGAAATIRSPEVAPDRRVTFRSPRQKPVPCRSFASASRLRKPRS
jgi:hypothetical protein